MKKPIEYAEQAMTEWPKLSGGKPHTLDEAYLLIATRAVELALLDAANDPT